MTSNLGSSRIQEGFATTNYQQMKEKVMEVVGKHFRPEFINRVDESVVFHPLSQDDIKAIALIQLAKLSERMKDNGYVLEISDQASDLIAQVGFDPIYGARPLKRAVQQSVENPLAKAILAGEIMPDKKIMLSVNNDKVVIEQL